MEQGIRSLAKNVNSLFKPRSVHGLKEHLKVAAAKHVFLRFLVQLSMSTKMEIFVEEQEKKTVSKWA